MTCKPHHTCATSRIDNLPYCQFYALHPVKRRLHRFTLILHLKLPKAKVFLYYARLYWLGNYKNDGKTLT